MCANEVTPKYARSPAKHKGPGGRSSGRQRARLGRPAGPVELHPPAPPLAPSSLSGSPPPVSAPSSGRGSSSPRSSTPACTTMQRPITENSPISYSRRVIVCTSACVCVCVHVCMQVGKHVCMCIDVCGSMQICVGTIVCAWCKSNQSSTSGSMDML